MYNYIAAIIKSISHSLSNMSHGETKTVHAQQQTLKPSTRLEGCIQYAQEICEDAGKLNLPQATKKAERLPSGCIAEVLT